MMKPDQLDNWAARALPGEDVVYSTGARPGEAIGAAVRQLHAAGLVTMTSKRLDGRLRHIVQRLPAPRASQQLRKPVPRGRFTVASDDAKRTMRAVLQVLRRAAKRGEPCPTNAEIARIVGLKDAAAASYRVRRLVKGGAIVVEEPSPLERRVVTIAATGAQTRRAKL
ncbi:winged helix-turn-helix domain-containing protein [Sphingobium yanoikuyae]|nr:winged helix-turn-helix domain-containing protein [Sphingobium yanoikuyae]